MVIFHGYVKQPDGTPQMEREPIEHGDDVASKQILRACHHQMICQPVDMGVYPLVN